MKFRKDINGLRALAVIAVIIYHFFPSALTGGFAGVDVFFVISGFLMTSIIFRGVQNKSFSLIGFYLARGNRIIPPLAALCLAVLLLGFVFLTSWDFKTLGKDIASSISFLSNVIFSLRKSYFEVENIFLLHTWSLSVEWQFYILYPIIVLFLCKFLSPASVKKAVIIMLILSFALCVYASVKWPVQAFFLFPMRAWEMLLGGIVFLYPVNFSSIHKKYLTFGGLFLIFVSYILLNQSMIWPGYLAAFPVVGTALVIWAQREDGFVLNNVVSQSLGKWSYSIYLWHWPVAVSYSYFEIDDRYKIIGVIISLLLGWLSYVVIERNLFFKKNTKLKNAIIHIGITIVLGAIGAYIFVSGGLADRDQLVHNSLIQGGTGNNHRVVDGPRLMNTDGNFDYVVIGDSNAGHFARGILHGGQAVKLSWYPACLSFPSAITDRDGYYPGWEEKCQNNYKLGTGQSDVIIAQSWVQKNAGLKCTKPDCGLTGDYFSDLPIALTALFEQFDSSQNIYLVGELPKPKDTHYANCLKSAVLTKIKRQCESTHEMKDGVQKVNAILRQVAGQFEYVHFLDMEASICTDAHCTFTQDGKALFMPDNHLSGFGSEIMWQHMMAKISTVQTQDRP